MIPRLLLIGLLCARMVLAEEPARAAYKSQYKVAFTFKEEDLIGDLLKGPRAEWKEQAHRFAEEVVAIFVACSPLSCAPAAQGRAERTGG